MSTTKNGKKELGLVCAARLRELVGGNPKELAYSVGISLSSVYNYINGRLPATDILYRIATAHNKPMEWFLEPEQFSVKKVAEELSSFYNDLYNE